MPQVYLLFGGNIGNVGLAFEKAIKLIAENIGDILSKSSIYKTEPWGFKSEDQFLNQALCVDTVLSPQELINEIIKIEEKIGRIKQTEKWSSRIIDIDILFYDNEIVKYEYLNIPHPLLHKRKFALAPMHEIKADYVHPVFKKTIAVLLNECNDKLNVEVCQNEI